jgi:hypothetical protein
LHKVELAHAVRDGIVKLDKALEELQSSEEQMARLRAEAPDLAAPPRPTRMKAAEAIRVLDGRSRNTQAISALRLSSSPAYPWPANGAHN